MGNTAVAGKPGSDNGTGARMDLGEMKKHVRFARDEPVRIAFAIGADGKVVLQMHRRKPGRALEKQLKEEAPESRNHRWGTLEMDKDNPKLARVIVNKPSSGISRKLVLALKGSGCRKVQLLLEDGTEIEAHEDEDEDGETGAASPQEARHGGRPEIKIAPRSGNGAQAGTRQQATEDDDRDEESDEDEDADEAPAASKAKQAGAAVPDAKTLVQALTLLVKRMLEAIKQDPTQKAALAELATDAQASLKRGDMEAAAAGIDVLRMALGDRAGRTAAPDAGSKGANGQGHHQPPHQAPHQDAGQHHPRQADPKQADPKQADPKQADPKQAGSHGASHPAAPIIVKARSAWIATRQKLQVEVDKLTRQFEAAFTDHEMADELAASFKARVGSIVKHLDEALSHKLDEVNKATDAAQRAKLVDEAHKVIARYSQHISSDPTIDALDHNPFVPMALAKTLTATLSVLSRTIH